MKFSMNGFRHNLSHDIEELRRLSKLVIRDEYYDKDEFVDAVNRIISHSNVLNCVSDENDPDFNEMSNLEVPVIEWD